MTFMQHCFRLARPLICFSALIVSASAHADKPYNIVFLLVDDLGWADVGFNGSTFYETPNIDALAASGVNLSHAYAASPVCSPTRASIMTGRHPVRVDITDWIPGVPYTNAKEPALKTPDDRDNLALRETTIAEALRDRAGYQTFFAGKWHLGDEGHFPEDQGFHINKGGHHKGSPPGGYYSPWTNPKLENHEDGEYLTDRLTDESVAFLEERDPDRPFLLYLSYYNVHTPIQPNLETIEHFEAKQKTLSGETPAIETQWAVSRGRQDNPVYASMVGAVDKSVGRLMAELETRGLAENTAVIFFSDNGGLSVTRRGIGPTSNLPLRAGKGWLYEGGVREPCVVSIPGVTRPGSQNTTPVMSTDFFPTLLELAGLEQDPSLHADGRSLLPVLKQKTGSDASTHSRALHWHYPHYHGSTWRPGASIRDGDWKLIVFYDPQMVELYNLKDDPGEQVNLAQSHADKADELRNKLAAWQEQIGAKMPAPLTEQEKQAIKEQQAAKKKSNKKKV